MPTFFHNADQLSYLAHSALPELIRTYGYGVKRSLVLWSAHCFQGEEAYSLAMVLHEFRELCPGLDFSFRIIATDSNAKHLSMAGLAIYPEDMIVNVPLPLRKKYLLRSRDREKRLIRMGAELRRVVKFRTINFSNENLKFREPVDIVFWHDVMARMTKELRQRLMNQFYDLMSPGGYLFTGIATLPDETPAALTPVENCIYRKLNGNSH